MGPAGALAKFLSIGLVERNLGIADSLETC